MLFRNLCLALFTAASLLGCSDGSQKSVTTALGPLSEKQIDDLLRSQIARYQNAGKITEAQFFSIDGKLHEIAYSSGQPKFTTAIWWSSTDNQFCKEYVHSPVVECFTIKRDSIGYYLEDSDRTAHRFNITSYVEDFGPPYPATILRFSKLLNGARPDSDISQRNMDAIFREAKHVERYYEIQAEEKALAASKNSPTGFDPGAFIIAIYASTIFDEFQRFDINLNRRIASDAQRGVVIDNKDQLIGGIDQLLEYVDHIQSSSNEIASVFEGAVPNLQKGNACQARLSGSARTLASDLRNLERDARQEESSLKSSRTLLSNARSTAQGDAVLAGIFGVYAGLTTGSSRPADRGLGQVQSAADTDRRLANMGTELQTSERNVQSMAQRATQLNTRAERLRETNQGCQ